MPPPHDLDSSHRPASPRGPDRPLVQDPSAAICRDLWQQVDQDGEIRVLAAHRCSDRHRWALQVAVPWCRFARSIANADEYAALLAKKRQHEADQAALAPSGPTPPAADTTAPSTLTPNTSPTRKRGTEQPPPTAHTSPTRQRGTEPTQPLQPTLF